MGEVERRRGYGWNRVLIESARILDPQFNDAVVFLSGAQIELLRNVTQYLNRLGTYAAEYNEGYYLVPTDEDFDDILEIVADLEETLMGNPNTIWGYADRWSAGKVGTSTGASSTDALMDAVPSGYVYVVEHWGMIHHADVARGTQLALLGGWGTDMLYNVPNLSPEIHVIETTHLTLKEGDALRMRVWGLELDNTCILYVWGYKMKVQE